MNEKIYITIDGRFVVLLFSILLLFAAIIIETLNIWLKNFDYRRRLGIDEETQKPSFLEYLLKKIIKLPLLGTLMVLISVPVIAIIMWIKYPRDCFRVTREHFIKQFKSAKESLLNRRGE